jgi:hypothetical protein
LLAGASSCYKTALPGSVGTDYRGSWPEGRVMEWGSVIFPAISGPIPTWFQERKFPLLLMAFQRESLKSCPPTLTLP